MKGNYIARKIYHLEEDIIDKEKYLIQHIKDIKHIENHIKWKKDILMSLKRSEKIHHENNVENDDMQLYYVHVG